MIFEPEIKNGSGCLSPNPSLPKLLLSVLAIKSCSVMQTKELNELRCSFSC